MNLTTARDFLKRAAKDGEIYPGRLAYWASAVHRAGIPVDKIAAAYDMDAADVEAMLREEE